MRLFEIVTDSGSDLTKALQQELEIPVAPLSVEYEPGVVFPDGAMDDHEFYDGIRSGKMPKTAAVNPEGWAELVKPLLANGRDVLILAFSSGLSTTYQSAVIAAQELQEVYPDRKIRVVDTLCAALGQGLLVHLAAQRRDAGEDIDTVYNWVLETRMKVCHWVTVEDLMHLKRGGRVSATTAMVGTMLNIKPIIHLDNEGKLNSVAKARGRKASLNYLVDKVAQTILPGQDTVFIGHGDCPEDAAYLEQQLKERCGIRNVLIGYVGNVIGSHTGPGVAVVFFLGQER